MSEIGQKLIAEVRKVAAERPDHVYGPANCQYMVNGQPSCIMGQALYRLGYLPSEVPIEDITINLMLSKLGIEVAPDELTWLCHVQNAQDGRVSLASHGPGIVSMRDRRLSWGQAVQYADGEPL